MAKQARSFEYFGNKVMGSKQMLRIVSTIVGLLMMLVLSAGCSMWGPSKVIYETVSVPTLNPGEAVPLPNNEVILTVTGKVGTTNEGNAILMDKETIEDVGLIEYEVHDPFENRPIIYRGVLMSDLLALWQVPDDVETIRLTALNDYQVDIPIEDFQQYPVLFAMQADGAYMEPSYRGPAMLVYPLDQYDFDIVSVKSRWIWQIKAIELF